jgi:peroxiredoxin
LVPLFFEISPDVHRKIDFWPEIFNPRKSMALTPSTMVSLGTSAPDFSLIEPATGRTVSLSDFSSSPALVVAFLCNHCPYVQHLRTGLAQFTQDYLPGSMAFVGISSNDANEYKADAPDKMAREARAAGWKFPYLYDETQETAKAYKAACTPDFFLYDGRRKLVYRGQFDDSRPGNGRPVTGADLRAAVEACLAKRPAPSKQMPSLGCNIKWKPGNEPSYFH